MTPSCWEVYLKTHKMKGDPSKWVSSKSEMVAVSYNSMILSFPALCQMNIKTIENFLKLVISFCGLGMLVESQGNWKNFKISIYNCPHVY
jgi:hypothetical protein